MKNKFVAYTALFGDYDNLVDPQEKYEGCDFICFTDQKNLKSDIWDIKIIEECDLPPNMMNRRYKILPHLFLSEYEQSLYIDANIHTIGNPVDLSKKYLAEWDIATPKHLERDCIYQEAKVCLLLEKTKFYETINQMNKYKANSFPRKFGLSDNSMIFRNHTKHLIVEVMESWWNELNNETQRDQLSLGYILWKYKMQFNFMIENARSHNNYFVLLPHKQIPHYSLYKKLYNRLRKKFIRIFIAI